MSTDQISYAPTAAPAKQIVAHPLCPITAAEIKQSADLIRSLYPAKTDFSFKVITLEESEKAQLVPYLDAEHSGGELPHIDRKTFVCYYLRNTVSRTALEERSWLSLSDHKLTPSQDKFHEAIINLSQKRVESNVRLGPNVHGPGDWEEILLVEKIALEDEGVKAEIAKLGLPKGTAVISDPWIYGNFTRSTGIMGVTHFSRIRRHQR